MKAIDYDILILGGGPVGLILGCLLIKQGFSVICLERAPLASYQDDNPNGQCLALSWGSLNLLNHLELKKPLIACGAAIEDIWVTLGNQPAALHYDSKVWNHPMGVNVESRYLKQFLYEKARNFLQTSTVATHLTWDQNKWQVLTNQGKTLKTRLVIGADGRHSWLRHQLGFKVKRWFYQQKSLVATLQHSLPHHQQAYEHFLPEGPLAFLPLPHQRSSLIWTVHPQTADALMHGTPARFLEHLSYQFGNGLGKLSFEIGPDITSLSQANLVRGYALEGLYCPRLFQHGAVLVGDAAHTMHPVAGQGFNVGLRDTIVLADRLTQARDLGLEWWGELTLQQYQNARKKDVLSLLGLTHGLVSLFSQDVPLLKSFLGQGLSLVDYLTPLKRFISQKAMGL